MRGREDWDRDHELSILIRFGAGERAGRAAVGATIKEVVWTQGQYDMVAITEVSDEVAATAFGLHTLTHGNVRAQTMRGRCHGVGGLVAEEHDENQLLRISVPCGNHSPGDLARRKT